MTSINNMDSKFSNFSHGKDNNNKFIQFNINNVDTSIVNSIRRVILSEIPQTGFYFDAYDNSDINVISNSSPIHNEFLAHRISLIPLHCSDDMDVDELCKYKYIINETNETDKIKTITSQHINIFDKDNNPVSSNIKETLFPKNPILKKKNIDSYILITSLPPCVNNPTTVHIDAKASCGIQKTSICYSCVSLCTFYNIINDEELKAKTKSIEDDISIDEDKRKQCLGNLNTIEKYKLFHKNVYGEPNKFKFLIESECGYTPQYILLQALTILKDKLTNLNTFDPKYIEIKPNDNMYHVIIYNESHTLGNLLQALLFNKYCRPTSNVLTYIGYNVQHPLIDNVVLKLKFKKDTDIIEFLKKAFSYVIEEHFEILIQEWGTFIKENIND